MLLSSLKKNKTASEFHAIRHCDINNFMYINIVHPSFQIWKKLCILKPLWYLLPQQKDNCPLTSIQDFFKISELLSIFFFSPQCFWDYIPQSDSALSFVSVEANLKTPIGHGACGFQIQWTVYGNITNSYIEEQSAATHGYYSLAASEATNFKTQMENSNWNRQYSYTCSSVTYVDINIDMWNVTFRTSQCSKQGKKRHRKFPKAFTMNLKRR